MMRDRQLLPNDASATDGVVMYETNFGLHRQPFQCADLARAFFASESIRSILPQLLHTMRSDLGIAVLTGPAGVGKTSLLKHLQTQLRHEGRAIMCSGASLESPPEVLQILQSASQLRAGESSGELPAPTIASTRWAVVEQMRRTTEFWGPILLLIDDAHLLSIPVLNELRAFTEEEWNGHALVRCLIAGPLNLEEELAGPAHADFSRRIRCHAFLQPLTSLESVEFLRRHLEIVGGQLEEVFRAKALELITAASDGLPRCLSLLADESLIVAFEQSEKAADVNCVRKALTRLQHLAYSWNASPLEADDVTSGAEEIRDESVSASTSTNGPGRDERASGIIEIGSRGVIEIGAGTSPSISAAAREILSKVAPVVRDGIPSTDFTLTPSDLVDVQKTYDSSFEVGHRYQPDALEASDVVEMDAFQDNSDESPGPAFADFFEIVGTPESVGLIMTTSSSTNPSPIHKDAEREPFGVNSGLTDELGGREGLTHSAHMAETATSAIVEDGHQKTTQDDSLHSNTTVKQSPRVRFPAIRESEGVSRSTALESSDRIGLDISGNELSSRLPVFDRYTWISLGREVPAGTYSVSSASEMQRVTSTLLGNDHEFAGPLATPEFSTTFDRIPVSNVRDSEILESLLKYTDHSVHGTFVMFRTPVNSNQVTEEQEELDSLALMPMEDSATPFVGVELFNPAEENGLTSISETHNAPDRENEAIFSESDRQVIRDAIRTTLSRYESEDQSITNRDADQADSSLNHGPGTAAMLNSLAAHGDDTAEATESGWHDGQLLFSDSASEAILVDAVSGRRHGQASEAETERISFSFEAARVARDEYAYLNLETGGPERVTEKFFTLPVNPGTIEWDLRSGLMACDDVSPLADSLASLREEVTSFQQIGRVENFDPNSTPSHHATLDGRRPGDSLVAIARRRLEIPDAAKAHILVGNDSLAEGLRSASSTDPETPPASGVTSAEQNTAMGSMVEDEVTTSHSDLITPPGSGFAQLFTRLRKIRTQAVENR